MTRVHGTTLPSLDDDALATACDSLLAHLDGTPAGAERVAVLPDAHYPYHPSTGMVTNPAVVDALAAALDEYAAEPPVEVVVAGDGPVDASTVATTLGYDGAGTDGHRPVVSLDGAGETVTGAEPAGEPPGVPDVLADAAVVVVPSVRLDHETGCAGALTTLTRAVGGDPTAAEDVRTALRAVDPVAGVADATYVFAGEPYRASTLFGSGDLRALDETVADLLSLADAGVPTPSESGEEDGSPVAVRGFDLDNLRAELPDGEPMTAHGPGRLVRAGYRLYAAVSGDVYPPQFRAQ